MEHLIHLHNNIYIIISSDGTNHEPPITHIGSAVPHRHINKLSMDLRTRCDVLTDTHSLELPWYGACMHGFFRAFVTCPTTY